VGEGSEELAVERGFIPQEKIRRTGGFGGAAEGEDGADAGGSGGGVLEGDVAVEGGFLRAPDAELTPAGDGHGLDEGHLSLGVGLVFVDEGGEESEEAAFVLAFEDDGGGKELVAGAVAGGAALAFRSGGAAGEGSVGARGSELGFCAGAVGHGCLLWGECKGSTPGLAGELSWKVLVVWAL
jgi:hypothetical protein